MQHDQYQEALVTKGTTKTDKNVKPVKIVEIARDTNQKLIGKGCSEGDVFGGIRVRMGKRELPMAEKIFSSPLLREHSEITPEKIIETHAHLKQLGFPVVNTVRIIDTPKGEFKRMLLTDLTEGGEKTVYTSSFDTDELPPKFSLVNPQEVMSQLLQIYKLCVTHGVEIDNHDAFFLVVDSTTGRGNIVLGDISRVKIHPNTNDPQTRLKVEAYGFESIEVFIDVLNTRITDTKLELGVIQEFVNTLGRADTPKDIIL